MYGQPFDIDKFDMVDLDTNWLTSLDIAYEELNSKLSIKSNIVL